MGPMIFMYIFSLEVHSFKDMMHRQVSFSLQANINNQFHQMYVCPANTALTISHAASSHLCSLPAPGHRHQRPSHCSGVDPDITGGKGLTAPSSSTQVMLGSGMRQENKLMDLTKCLDLTLDLD